MSRKTIGGLVALAAVGAATVAVASPGGDDAAVRPPYASVTIDLGEAQAKASAKGLTAKKPRLVYLQSSQPEPINPAPPPTGVGPYIDVTLAGCSKVVDGGVVPSDTDVYQQGSYVKGKAEYHVLIALDDGAPPDLFSVTSHLTCLKGVK